MGKRVKAGPAVVYGRYAGLFLGVSVLAGLWLRGGLYHPPLVEGVEFRNLVHAHSHLAFYGWATMAVFAAVVAFTGAPAGVQGYLRVHAHVVAALSAAAFVTFLRGGYSMASVAVSTAHVVAWGVFVVVGWPRGECGPAGARALFRLALGFLAVAGVGTLAPLLVMFRGAASPWVDRLAIEIFLVPFVSGWLVVGALGALYGLTGARRPPRVALAAIAVGVVPSALAFPPGAPPAAYLPLLGRLGLALAAVGVLAVMTVLVRQVAEESRGASVEGLGLIPVALGALVVKGLADLAIASGLAAGLMHNHSMTVAYLHLALLGAVTAALLEGLRPRAEGKTSSRATVLYAAGLAAMVTPLAIMGWPAAFNAAASLGIGTSPLLALSLAGGGLLVAVVMPLAGALLLTPAQGRTPALERPGTKVEVAGTADGAPDRRATLFHRSTA